MAIIIEGYSDVRPRRLRVHVSRRTERFILAKERGSVEARRS